MLHQTLGQAARDLLRILALEFGDARLVLRAHGDELRLEPGFQRTGNGLPRGLGHFESGELTQLRPVLQSILAETRHLGIYAQPAQAPVRTDRVNERGSAFALAAGHPDVLVERHGRVPLLAGQVREVVLESAFGGRPVRDGQGDGERLLSARIIEMAQAVGRPIGVRRRIAREAQAVREGRAGARIVGQEREGPAFESQPRGAGRSLIGEAVLLRTGRVEVEERGAPLVQAFEHAGHEVSGRGLGRLVHEDATMGDSQETRVLRSRGAAAARLTGVRVSLGIENHHADRPAGREDAREVLEARTQHGPVAAHGHDRRAQEELLVGEFLPVEGGESRLVDARVIRSVEEVRRATHVHEAVGHLAHVRFEQADRDGRRVLGEMRDPGKRVRIEGICAPPGRRAAGRVGEAERRAALAARSLRVAPAQVAERIGGPGDPLELLPVSFIHRHRHRALRTRRGVEVGARGEQRARLQVESFDKPVELRHVLRHPGRHLRLDGGENEVRRGLLATARARAVAAHHGAVGILLEEQGREHSGNRAQIRGLQEPVVGVGQAVPQRPVATEAGKPRLVLLHADQGAGRADLDAEVASLACVRIDGDRQETARSFRLRLEVAEERLCPRQREFGQPGLHHLELRVGLGAALGIPSHLRRHRVVGERVGETDGERGVLLQELVRLLAPVAGQRAQTFQGGSMGGHVEGRAEHVVDAAHETGNGGVRALHPAFRAARAFRPGELGRLEPQGAQVAHRGGGRGNGADRGEGIGDAVLPQRANGAHLLPEASFVSEARPRVRRLDERRHVRHVALLRVEGGVHRNHGLHFVEAPAHGPQLVLRGRGAEGLAEAGAQTLEQGGLALGFAGEHRHRAHEGAQERRRLHAPAAIGVRHLGARDRHGVEAMETDPAVDDGAADPAGETLPELLGGEVALNDEDAAIDQALQRIRVAEDVGIRREDGVEADGLGVQPHGLGREHHGQGDRLSVLRGLVVRAGLDVEAKHVECRSREVPADLLDVPSSPGMDAQGDGAFRAQVEVARGGQGPGTQLRIALGKLVLPDLELGQPRAGSHELDTEIEVAPSRAERSHVLDRGRDVAGLQVAAAETEAGRVELGHVATAQGEEAVVRRADPAVLLALRHGPADLAKEGRIGGERLVDALHHHHTLPADQHGGDEVRRERTEHGEIEDADLQAALFAKVFGHRLGIRHHRPLTDDHPLRFIETVTEGARVPAAGEGRELPKRLVGDFRDVVEVERTLGRDTLRVGIPVLQHPEHGRIVEVEHLRNATADVAENETLRPGGTVDPVRGVAQVLLDQGGFGKEQGGHHVAREIAVLGQDAGVQGQFGDPMRDEVQIRRLLHVLREELEEAGVVDRVVVVVTRLGVLRLLGQGASRHVHHTGEALARERVERLVHGGEPRSARESRGAETRHAQACGDRGRRGVVPGLEGDELPSMDVRDAPGRRRRPSVAHLRGRGYGTQARGIARRGFHGHHRARSIERLPDAWVPGRRLGGRLGLDLAPEFHACTRNQTIAPVGQRVTARSSASPMRA